MTAISGMNEEICKIIRFIGLDPTRTRSVTINIPCDDVVTVISEQYVFLNGNNTGELETKKFNLIPIEE